MQLLPTADGRLEYLVTGAGEPATVFGHGLAGSILDTRPLGSGVLGRRVFLHFRGHGASTGTRWSYPALAEDLRAIADAVGARRAVGVSMGAGALTALLAQSPDRFERVVFFLPGVLDRPRNDPARSHLARLADAVADRDDGRLAELLADELPASVRHRPEAKAYVVARAAAVVGGSTASALRSMPGQVPVAETGRRSPRSTYRPWSWPRPETRCTPCRWPRSWQRRSAEPPSRSSSPARRCGWSAGGCATCWPAS